ncbi:MAG: DNA polymerase III subunit beta [Lentisphaerales bacterium]|nr:DNA polymerase III subunit beta [Lentisphaerales bacterium]
MKITIDQSALASGLAHVQSAVSNRPTIPVLSNLLLQAENGQLTITATDLDLSISTSLECSVEAEGSTTLPAKKLIQIIRQLNDAPVTIDTDENHVSSISCHNSFFKLLGINDSEFPTEDGLEEARTFTLPNIQLRKMLEKISYSVSTDETRHVLNGILLSIREGTLTAVATDGRRLALIETVLDSSEVVDGDTILPSKAVSELQKLLSDAGEVKISLGDTRALFETNNTVMRTKLVEGTYPNYRQVIPGGFSQMIEIPREELSKALSRVSLILTESGSSVKLEMESDKVILSASSNADESSEPIPVTYLGDNLAISFNPNFLHEPLKKLDCNNITIKFNDKISPIGIFGDEGFLYVIMPMRN